MNQAVYSWWDNTETISSKQFCEYFNETFVLFSPLAYIPQRWLFTALSKLLEDLVKKTLVVRLLSLSSTYSFAESHKVIKKNY